MKGSVRRRCTKCAVNAREIGRAVWQCPRNPDHQLKWSAVIDVSPAGARRRQIRRTFETKKEAERWAAERQIERATGVYVELTNLTLEQYLIDRLASSSYGKSAPDNCQFLRGDLQALPNPAPRRHSIAIPYP